VNGESVSLTFNGFDISGDIDLTRATYRIGTRYDGSKDFLGVLSDFYFDTTYIDLSANNPFWDSDLNKPKFLGENGELPTGSSPLIYLPLRADDAGSNKGTGGDFTVNSGPYVGARGPSEFWAESASFADTSSEHLARNSAITGLSSGKVFSFAVAVKKDATGDVVPIMEMHDTATPSTTSTDIRLRIELGSTGRVALIARDSSDSDVLNASSGTSYDNANWQMILGSVDLSDTGKRQVYVDGSAASITWSTYANANIDFSGVLNAWIGKQLTSDFADGRIGFFWFNTEYIDFSQEANRLKFFDAFNYPVDLGEDGSLPTGNQPLIYLNNDFHLGTNLGSGGDFTPQNTPSDGGSVKG